MVRHLRANAVAYLALLVALGGTSYAALKLPANSVGTRQLRNRAVTPKKVAPATVSLFRGRTGPAGAKGEKGEKGDTGPAGPFPGVLPSGKTLRGAWALSEENHSAEVVDALASISFGFTFAVAPTVILVRTSSLACPGTAADPRAAVGNLCIYTAKTTGTTSLQVIDPGGQQLGNAGTEGAIVSGECPQATACATYGSWAATSP